MIRGVVVAKGSFGKGIMARLMAAGGKASYWEAASLEDAFEAQADVVVYVIDHFDRVGLGRADELAYASGVSWVPVIREFPTVRIGPYVSPPEKPCFRCSLRRRLQHESADGGTLELWEDDLRRGGSTIAVLSHELWLTVAHLSAVITRPQAGKGTVVALNIANHQSVRSRVVPCVGCRNCGVLRPSGVGERAV